MKTKTMKSCFILMQQDVKNIKPRGLEAPVILYWELGERTNELVLMVLKSIVRGEMTQNIYSGNGKDNVEIIYGNGKDNVEIIYDYLKKAPIIKGKAKIEMKVKMEQVLTILPMLVALYDGSI